MDLIQILNLYNKAKKKATVFKYYCLDDYKCGWFEDSGFIVCEGCPRRCIIECEDKNE